MICFFFSHADGGTDSRTNRTWKRALSHLGLFAGRLRKSFPSPTSLARGTIPAFLRTTRACGTFRSPGASCMQTRARRTAPRSTTFARTPSQSFLPATLSSFIFPLGTGRLGKMSSIPLCARICTCILTSVSWTATTSCPSRSSLRSRLLARFQSCGRATRCGPKLLCSRTQRLTLTSALWAQRRRGRRLLRYVSCVAIYFWKLSSNLTLIASKTGVQKHSANDAGGRPC